jgi:hypothetical protein
MDPKKREKLIAFCRALIDPQAAKVLIEPQERSPGFWFGGGNLVEAPSGTFYLTGRYRNFGDSRTGLEAGTRGVELALFESTNRGKHFEKILAFSKADLSPEGKPVLSIEGSALHFTDTGVELFVSSEKGNIAYPTELSNFQKPGTGVWTIERLKAASPSGLADANLEPVLTSDDPRFQHVKDPVIYEKPDGTLVLGFCTHPFNWTSSNSGYAIRKKGDTSFDPPDYTFFRRGYTWDVAISRITSYLPVPALGVFREGPPWLLAFYDGGESMRQYEEHTQAVRRPRGYSCEEIGGVAVLSRTSLRTVERLSNYRPMFISPEGTGSNRYVDVLETEEGFYATWERSYTDGSQPLVINFLSRERARALLT